jgi:hypothetical protein
LFCRGSVEFAATIETAGLGSSSQANLRRNVAPPTARINPVVPESPPGDIRDLETQPPDRRDPGPGARPSRSRLEAGMTAAGFLL